MSLRVLPNVTSLIVAFLRADPDVSAIAGQRGYAIELPENPTLPCYRVTRFGGLPAFQVPFELDTADLQIDTWGATHKQASDLINTIRAALSARLPGKQPTGIVTAVDHGTLADSPDPTFDPPRPRCIADVTVTYRPL